jgi:phenylacetate-CoA ligase
MDFWEELQQSQYFSPEKLEALQAEKLGRLLDHAYAKVPYYRDAFDKAGVKPADIAGPGDLAKLPLLDKETVKTNAEGCLLAEGADLSKALKIRSSGSTGMPMHIYCDASQLDMRYGAVLRSWEWTGWKFGDPTLRLWHQTIGMTEEQVSMEWIDAFLLRREFLPVFEMNDKNLMKYILQIKEYNPVFIDGYAEAFDILARFILANGVHDVFVPSIVSSAQMLSGPMRENISKAMRCEIFDRYGCREFSTLAHECPAHQNYHVNAENLIVEIVKNDRPAPDGELGEVVVTDLNNTCQPLIRYRLGDLAQKVSGACACGRGLPLIGTIHGRTKGVVVGPNGTYLTTSFFLHYLKDFDDEIRQFQIVQETKTHLVLTVVPEGAGRGLGEAVRKRITEDFRKHLGKELDLEFRIVDQIEMVKTGKHLSVLSKLDLDFQELVNNGE